MVLIGLKDCIASFQKAQHVFDDARLLVREMPGQSKGGEALQGSISIAAERTVWNYCSTQDRASREPRAGGHQGLAVLQTQKKAVNNVEDQVPCQMCFDSFQTYHREEEEC